MKRAITYEAPKAAGEGSQNIDATKRAIEFVMVTVNKHDADAENAHDFADFMYEYIRPLSEEELIGMFSDLDVLVNSCKFFQKAVAHMLAGKLTGEEPPPVAEARARRRGI